MNGTNEQALAQVEEMTLAEIVKKAGDPQAAMEELDLHFKILTQSNIHPDVKQVIENAWGLAGRVYEAAGVSFSLLVAARVFAQELESQRDTAIEENADLRAGLEDPWGASHPLVEAAMDMIREAEGETALEEYSTMYEQWKLDEFDSMAEEAQEYAEEVIHDQMADEVAETLGITGPEAWDVLELLRGGDGNLTEQEQTEFWDWFMAVVARLQNARQARRMAAQAQSA